jgi:putative protein-disulfide isomerase
MRQKTIITNESSNMTKPKLLYVGDPMCSWCWGFANVISELLENYEDKLEFEILLGGLRPTNDVKVDEKMKDFLLHHWTEVNKRTGQKFDHTILDQLGWIYNTEPACRAVATLRELEGSSKALHFFNHLQKAYYAEGNIITTDDVIKTQATNFGIETEAFMKKFSSDTAKQKIFHEFGTVQQIGIQGFPTLLFIKGDSASLVATGYSDYDKVSNRIDTFMNA